jgi:hypothetical protein
LVLRLFFRVANRRPSAWQLKIGWAAGGGGNRLVNGIGYEAKAGVNVGLTPAIRKQVPKDAELVATGQLRGAEWHFFQGAQDDLLMFLKEKGSGTWCIHEDGVLVELAFFEQLTDQEAQAFLEKYRAVSAEHLGDLERLVGVRSGVLDFRIESVRPAFEVFASEVAIVPTALDGSLPDWIKNSEIYRSDPRASFGRCVAVGSR